jgi:hypothetical protein
METKDWRDKLIKTAVDRFLGWKLPEDFNPDAGISFVPEYNVEYNAKYGKPPARYEPVGTNLFTATQAKGMVEHILGDSIQSLLDTQKKELAEKVRALPTTNEDDLYLEDVLALLQS